MKESRYQELCALAGPVSRETFAKLLEFEQIFLKWAQKINLVAPSTISALWARHILDSAQLMRLAPNALKWLDLGSGGGFPGAVVAILLLDRPGARIRLVESNSKKAGFLRAVLGELQVPAEVVNARIEAIVGQFEDTEVVTARALAPLSVLLQLALPWLSGTAAALFHKGRDYRVEVEESRDVWRFDLVEHTDKVDPDGVILGISKLQRRN